MKLTIRQTTLIIEQLQRTVEANEKRLENLKGTGFQLSLKTNEMKKIIDLMVEEQISLVDQMETQILG